MFTIDGTRITMTRGDTVIIDVSITMEDGTPYIPQEGDSLRFAVKKDYFDDEVLILKDIPISTMQLRIDPEDTKPLDMGAKKGLFKYDIQLTTADGRVDTVIPRATLVILEEVE